MDDGRERLIAHVLVTRGQPTWRIIVLANIIFVGLSLITYLAFLIWSFLSDMVWPKCLVELAPKPRG